MEITPEIQELLDAQALTINKERDASEASLLKNRDDLLQEKKLIADEKASILKEKAIEDELEKQKKAASDGDTQALLDQIKANKETSQAEKDALTEQLEEMKKEKVEHRLKKLAKSFVEEFGLPNKLAQRAMADYYRGRIDERDGKVVVLDSDGNLTGYTIEDLNKEFIGADLYQGHLIGTKAIGGGAVGSRNGGGATSTNVKADEAKNKGDAIGHLNAHFGAHFKK